MRAEISEMQELMSKGTRQQMVDYLESHRPESRDETEIYEKLRNKEFSLRGNSGRETQKTKSLLSNSQRNRGEY